jgi:hypothetical protein
VLLGEMRSGAVAFLGGVDTAVYLDVEGYRIGSLNEVLEP